MEERVFSQFTRVSPSESRSAVREIQTGNVVTVYEENKRGEWKMAIVENLIKGKDNVVRGANVRVIAKGKPVRISRPVQKLYPIEVKSVVQGNDQIEHRVQRERNTPLRHNPSRSAALDSRWKTKSMLDS